MPLLRIERLMRHAAAAESASFTIDSGDYYYKIQMIAQSNNKIPF